MFIERHLIFFPSPATVGNWNPVAFPFEDAWFEASDGVKLHGWYVPCKDAKAVVLFCHGNGGNITDRTPLLQILHQLVGVSVLAFDYRGYGRSGGTPSESGTYADARAARAWLAAKEKIPERDIVVMGESLGGGVAVELAANDGARALVLQSTFCSLPDVAAYHYPWLPARWLMSSRFNSLGKIARYHGPLFQAHGAADTIVPFSSGQALFHAANEPKEFFFMPGHNHNDSLPLRYFDVLKKFIEKLPPTKS
jgi:fermentation-respiration switch protein FrsA (DUF1100 family)